MPSDLTAHHDCAPDCRPRRPCRQTGGPRVGERVLGLLILALAGLVVLVGCASGAERDARQAERAEATRGVILPDRQSTSVVERFFPPSPTPGPTQPPLPGLESLVLATAVGSDGRPQQEVTSLAGGGTLYVAALLNDLSAGSVVSAVWTDADGTEFARSEVEIDGSARQRWVALPWQVDASLPRGQYAVYVFVDERPLGSLVVRLV